ncbi:MAG: MBL fold metallo-hydrolase [Steroidobacteraceae bacterium]|nr:MBL fold metallo-hydrolase [Nevskiaceae bacterium]MCP5360831.1 MBL fold metallo-hydrolase [Nevskiaceae bacterium]MCP5470986.1 MBL fold metallo-hydrolase [Nevskiaceae bacterium]
MGDAATGSAGGDSGGGKGRGWEVESLGRGVFLFRWNRGFYLSTFVVGERGVTAIDPISTVAAGAYREAIASVTDRPLTRIVYSHDHRDHICGGHVLAAGALECEVCAHEAAQRRIAQRGDDDVLAPTRLIGDGEVLADGAARLEVRYFGPNHSDSNLLFLLPTDRGRMLIWVDGIEPGVAPYRNLPDTDFGGYLHSLEQASKLEFDFVVGGHTGPGGPEWVTDYREYILRLLDATRLAYRAVGEQTPQPGEDGVAMTERVRGEVAAAAAATLRDRFGHWSGYVQWAPQTADRILSYLITGN